MDTPGRNSQQAATTAPPWRGPRAWLRYWRVKGVIRNVLAGLPGGMAIAAGRDPATHACCTGAW